MLDARPPLDDVEVDAVRAALELAQRGHRAYESGWRRAAVAESTVATYERADEDGYALSPRSTRGATRA